ncbi:hypothetical protein O181_008191 [Austropuccinia psidii MF-1]|uniref:Uncharacterized protein n=1 Tax=Austropuccinia psidii MF-1 TaxID=1389203 RepID=A0A9Q3GIA5_9BASI|nr:hypothetical protein [Austropuccinia psidii MF-1]
MELIRGIEMIKERFKLAERLVTERFKTLFTKEAHRWYILLRQAHEQRSWTWWKTQVLNKWANDSWRFNIKTAFEYEKLNSARDRALPWFCQQNDRPTALYTKISEFIIFRRIMRQCGGDLEHSVQGGLLNNHQQKILSI